MRLIQNPDQEKTFNILDDMGIDFVSLSTDRQDAFLVSFPLPSGAVEETLNRLQTAGIETEEYTLISDLDAAITANFDELEKRYAEGSDAESRVARGELRASAREIEPDRTMFIAQAILSAAVAAAGLLLNSSIAIVGSMVISPFTSSLLSMALGAIVGDQDLFVDGLKSQLFGLSLAAFTGTGIGLLANLIYIIAPNHAITGMKQIQDFSSPSLLLLIIAITAGSASAIALATNQGIVLAGVAIAAAIVPSATAIGVGLAWNQPSIAFGAFIVLLSNVLSINITSYLTFLLLGYKPSLLKNPPKNDIYNS